MNVIVQTIAFHDAPGMLRRITLRNVSGNAISVGHAALDILPLHAGGAQVFTDEFRHRSGKIRWESDERAVAVMSGKRGLFLGIEQGGVYALFEPNPDLCTLGCPEIRLLRSGEIWQLPETILVAFSGALEDASRGPLAQVLMMARKLRRHEEKIKNVEKKEP